MASERGAVQTVIHLAAFHEMLTLSLIDRQWFTDGITETELNVINRLRNIAYDYSETAAERIVSMPFLVTVEPADPPAMTSLAHMAYFRPDAFDDLMSHSALDSGITDDLAPIVAMLYGLVETNPGLVDTLLNRDRVRLERLGITLPLSGNVDLVIVRTSPHRPWSMELLEHSVRTVEELMDRPLPTQYIGLLFETSIQGLYGGSNFGTHMTIRLDYDVYPSSPEARNLIFVMSHEVAHYYWRGNVGWIDEGIANFMQSAIENKRTGKAVSASTPPCAVARRIVELELTPNPGTEEFSCIYSLGERLFLDLYHTLGSDQFWRGLRELYTKSQVDAVTVEHVREAFQSNPSAAAVINRWYDGT